ncbi:integrase [Actinoplanes sp. NPDC051343]|uniref:integrase n=1 Tax=Actinoplanes sp. NPDC051343 TaxID=3363906 RepID=UPI0037AB6C51
MSTYDVKVWSIQEHHGKDRKTGNPKTTYRVRWVVAGKVFGDHFETKALAESHRAKLLAAQREGVAFDEEAGLPEPMARALRTRSWYDHAVAFVDMKWPRAAAKQRMSIAEALSNVTMAVLKATRGALADATIRRALCAWSFNKARRDAGPPPDDLAPAIRWVAANTVNLNDLEDAALVRKALDGLSLRLDGKQAAATTIARKRAVFYGALRYGVKLRLIPAHPMDHVQWITPKSDDEVDRGSVINLDQAIRLLSVVAEKRPHLVAFFACLYYAAMRPAEALHLRIEDCEVPEEGWGMLRLTGSTQHVGQGWGDDSEAVREDRELKAPGEDGRSPGARCAGVGTGAPLAHRSERLRARWPAVCHPEIRPRPGIEGDVLASLASCSARWSDVSSMQVAAGEASVRPAACCGLALAQ